MNYSRVGRTNQMSSMQFYYLGRLSYSEIFIVKVKVGLTVTCKLQLPKLLQLPLPLKYRYKIIKIGVNITF